MNTSPRLIAILRRLLLAIATLATLLVVLVVVENWRGDRAWAKEESALRKKGESLDLEALRPSPVPDDQNLFRSPLLARVVHRDPGDEERKRILVESRLMEPYDFGSYGGRLKDFFALRESLKQSGLLVQTYTDSPAADVFIAMQPMWPLLDELVDAARLRPFAVMAIEDYSPEGPMLDLDLTFRMAQALGVRACAEVELGRFDEAYADIYALQRFANGLAKHPVTLLNQLVGIAIHDIAARAICHGCERHIWTEARLAEFQNQMGELQPLIGFNHAMRVERAHMIYLVDAQPVSGSPEIPRWFPRGWLQQNKVTYCERLEREILSTFTTVPERIFSAPNGTGTESAGPGLRFLAPYGFIARKALSNIGEILGGLGSVADRLTLVSVICGIERYHAANGRYPMTLDELVPKFLLTIPNGLSDGQPPRFTELPSAGRQVYFIGVNGRDEGGNGDDNLVKLPDRS
jgi:hypothetical protein